MITGFMNILIGYEIKKSHGGVRGFLENGYYCCIILVPVLQTVHGSGVLRIRWRVRY